MDGKPIPTLKTERLILRAFELSDAADVQRLAGDSRIATTTLNIPHPYEEGMAETWISEHRPSWEAGKTLTLAITNEEKDLIGAISLKIDPPHNRAELGYWIGVPYWNRGYASEASGALVQFGFEQLGLNRIDAHYLSGNEASGKVMQNIGMRHEGVLRQYLVKNGETKDVILYAILASEYQKMD